MIYIGIVKNIQTFHCHVRMRKMYSHIHCYGSFYWPSTRRTMYPSVLVNPEQAPKPQVSTLCRIENKRIRMQMYIAHLVQYFLLNSLPLQR